MSPKIKVAYNGRKAQYRYNKDDAWKDGKLSALKKWVEKKWDITEFDLDLHDEEEARMTITDDDDIQDELDRDLPKNVLWIYVKEPLEEEEIGDVLVDKECDVGNPLITNCKAIKNLVYILNKFGEYNLLSNVKQQEEFIEYCDSKYKTFADDFDHLVNKHKSDFRKINKSLLESCDRNYLFAKCDLLNCGLTISHHNADKNKAKKVINNDDKLGVFCQMFDDLHYYLVHLYDVGLRVQIPQIIIQESKYDEEDDFNYFDSTFEKCNQIIGERIKETEHFEFVRYGEDNNKFKVENQAKTWISALFDNCRKFSVSKQTRRNLATFLRREEFDSDSVQYDFEYDLGGIEHFIEETAKDYTDKYKYAKCIKQFIKDTNLTASAFSVGVDFYYWDYYKKKQEEKAIDIDNINDHGGYDLIQLYVEKKYNSFKEEILTHLFVSEYNQLVINKATEHMNTDKVSKMKACDDKYMKHLHYSDSIGKISAGDPIKIQHLISVIMYCDFTQLCTEFSSTFRRVRPKSTTQATKKSIKYTTKKSIKYTTSSVKDAQSDSFNRDRGRDSGRDRGRDRAAEPKEKFGNIKIDENIETYSIDVDNEAAESKEKFGNIKIDENIKTYIDVDDEAAEEFVVETLASMKRRNSEWWWMSRYLREAVQIFGDNGIGVKNVNDPTKSNLYQLKGPFYSGMGFIALLPQFNMRLYSPTSTTGTIEVALRFASRDGLVMQLNNTGDIAGSSFLRGLSVSFISSYKEEDETIFFGGDYRIRLESIRIIDTAQNFENFQHALFWFDCMLTGSFMMDCADKIKKFDCKIINKLIKFELEKKRTDFDEYILGTFRLFCTNKKTVVLNIEYMDKYFNCESQKGKKFYECIMHSVEHDDDTFKGIDDHNDKNLYMKRNLFQPKLITLFPNLKEVIIYCVSREDQDKSYSLSFFNLLNCIQESANKQFEVKVKSHWKHTGYEQRSWLFDLWKGMNKGPIEAIYNKRNWSIDLIETKNTLGHNEDCIYIKRK